MIELHPFLNSDSPGIAAVWSDQPPLRGRLEKLTTTSLEQHILSKPYFDPRGLIVAHDCSRAVGFVHVGFAPSMRPGELQRQTGVVSLLMVSPRADEATIAGSLLVAGETWLRDLGATEMIGGGSGLHAPFYLGLYGGCQLPGVLAGDKLMVNALRVAGYVEHREFSIWHKALDSFRPPVDRELVTLRRQYRLRSIDEDPINSWSDACAYSWIEPRRFGIDAVANDLRAATLTFWNMEPVATGWGQRAMGLAELVLYGTLPRGLLTCFLAEAMRQFQTEGVNLLEIQTEAECAALSEACRTLGFGKVDRGIQFRKSIPKSVV